MMSIEDLNIHQRIFNFLDFNSQIKYRQINKFLHFNLISKIRYIPDKYIPFLTNNILRWYPKLLKLDFFYEIGETIGCNTKITDLSFMEDMKYLSIGCWCGGDNCFKEEFSIKLPPNIEVLDMTNNPYAKISGNLPNLKELYIDKNSFFMKKSIGKKTIYKKNKNLPNHDSKEDLNFEDLYLLAPNLRRFGYLSSFDNISLGRINGCYPIIEKYNLMFETMLQINPNLILEY